MFILPLLQGAFQNNSKRVQEGVMMADDDFQRCTARSGALQERPRDHPVTQNGLKMAAESAMMPPAEGLRGSKIIEEPFVF